MYFVDCLLIGVCWMFCSGLGWCYGVLAQINCHFHHIVARLHTVNMTYLADIDLDDLVGSVCRFFHSKVTFLPLLSSLEGSHSMQPTSEEWRIILGSYRLKYLHGSFGILSDRFVSSSLSIQSFICLY